MSKQEIGLKKSMGLEEAIGYLDDLVKSLKQGEVYLKQGDDYLTLTPEPTVTVEVRGKVKKEKGKFSLTLSWAKEDEPDEETDIEITSQKPEGSDEEILESIENDD